MPKRTPQIKKRRKFGGKLYRYRISSTKKSIAQGKADAFRRAGNKARVVDRGDGLVYDVFTR
jgi:hypothetical protein